MRKLENERFWLIKVGKHHPFVSKFIDDVARFYDNNLKIF